MIVIFVDSDNVQKLRMFDQNINDCLEELKKITTFTAKNVPDIIDKYCQIVDEELELLSEAHINDPDMIEDRYIPSPELVASFQNNKSRTMRIKPQIINTKLKQLYGFSKVGHNNRHHQKYEIEDPLMKPSIMVEQREENILEQLRKKQIMATLPNMQSSLIENEVRHLKGKNINLDNYEKPKVESQKEKGSLKQWKQMRQKFMKNLCN